MSLSDPCLIRSRGPCGEPVVRLGIPLVDDYLEFLAGRSRPNTVLAAAYDLKVFFSVVAKPVEQVCPADVLGFITAQRTGRSSEQLLRSVDVNPTFQAQHDDAASKGQDHRADLFGRLLTGLKKGDAS